MFWKFRHPWQWMDGYDYMTYGAGASMLRAKPRPLLFRLRNDWQERQWNKYYFMNDQNHVCFKSTGEEVPYL